MAAGFRVDQKGRSSTKLIPRDKKLFRIPAPFAAIPLEVMRSPAFRTAGIHTRRLLDALLIEHVAHGSQENGRLVATYDQLEGAGIPRRKIRGAIADGEARGLIRRTAIGSGNRRTGDRAPSRYRLTFLSSVPDRMGPTDEWRNYMPPPGTGVPTESASASATTRHLRMPHGGTP